MAGTHKIQNKKTVCVVIAAFNEAAAISQVVKSVLQYAEQVVVVDDASIDTTSVEASKAGATVIKHLFNLGQGAALQTGFTFVNRTWPESIVVTFDADGQFEPSEISQAIKPVISGGYQVVLGSRFLGRATGMPFLRKVLLKMGIVFNWFMSGVHLTDAHNGFRVFSPDSIKQINIRQNRMAHASEIIDQIVSLKLKYIEVPVTVRYFRNRVGQSNVGSLQILRDIVFEKFS